MIVGAFFLGGADAFGGVWCMGGYLVKLGERVVRAVENVIILF